jgi:hypothetical protein
VVEVLDSNGFLWKWQFRNICTCRLRNQTDGSDITCPEDITIECGTELTDLSSIMATMSFPMVLKLGSKAEALAMVATLQRSTTGKCILTATFGKAGWMDGVACASEESLDGATEMRQAMSWTGGEQ